MASGRPHPRVFCTQPSPKRIQAHDYPVVGPWVRTCLRLRAMAELFARQFPDKWGLKARAKNVKLKPCSSAVFQIIGGLLQAMAGKVSAEGGDHHDR